MIRASDLIGRAVIDLTSAKKLGEVAEVLIDPVGRHVAGFVLSRGSSLVGGAEHLTLPATAVHAIGPDAVTVRGAATAPADLGGYPRLGQVVGRKMVTHGGVLLGTIGDVLVEPADGRIVGYAVDSGRPLARLEGLLGGGRTDHGAADYVRAEADLVVGEDLVVVPNDAVVRAEGRPPAESVAPTVFNWPDPPRDRPVSSEGAVGPPAAGSAIEALSHAPPPRPATAQTAPPEPSDATVPLPVDPGRGQGRVRRAP